MPRQTRVSRDAGPSPCHSAALALVCCGFRGCLELPEVPLWLPGGPFPASSRPGSLLPILGQPPVSPGQQLQQRHPPIPSQCSLPCLQFLRGSLLSGKQATWPPAPSPRHPVGPCRPPRPPLVQVRQAAAPAARPALHRPQVPGAPVLLQAHRGHAHRHLPHGDAGGPAPDDLGQQSGRLSLPFPAWPTWTFGRYVSLRS